ncbi:MAG: GTP-binding protein [Aquificaceae bacterium]
MNLRILYHGLGMAGKTTNLERLREIYAGYVSDRMHQRTTEGRTVYLDMLSLNLKTKSGDREIGISLFTTPGQERFKLLRGWLFGHVDGVVFVLDSSRSMEENMRAYEELREYGLLKVPVVVQANKRDVPEALPLELIKESFGNITVVEAIAGEGQGVAETLREIIREVLNAKASVG